MEDGKWKLEKRGQKSGRTGISSGLGVETVADDAGKGVRQVGLLQIIQSRVELEILAKRLRAVAGGENDFQLWPFNPETFSQFAPVEAAGHDDVGENEADFIFVFFPDLQGVVAVHGLKDPVAVADQSARDDVAQVAFVLDDKHGLG